MGLLNVLFGHKPQSRVAVTSEAIWLSSQAKFDGIRRDLLNKANGDSVAILLIAHFDDVHAHLQAILEDYHQQVPAIVVRACELSSSIASRWNVDNNAVIDLIVAERHPLVSQDAQVLAGFAEDLPCRCRVSYHVSLEDPLIQWFGGPEIRELLIKMGMKEDEAIESQLVHRRIQRAQKAMTKAASGNQPAETAQKWLALNVPSNMGRR